MMYIQNTKLNGRGRKIRYHGEDESMVKKLFYIVLVLSTIVFSASGCGRVGTEESESASALPSDAIMAIEGNEIYLYDATLSLPTGVSYGKRETEDGISYYVWKSGAEYVLPSSIDVLFYIYEGNDKKSPDPELEDGEVRSSFGSYIQNGFGSEVEEPRIMMDAGITSNNDWYTLCFTGYGGATQEITTYGVYCYPKSYYGVYLLQKGVSEDHTRNYYGFVFSNDGQGDIFTEEEYDLLFGQIKSGFEINEFFSLPQLNYDAAQDFSDGYNYKQLQELFKDTWNYYIITGNRAVTTLKETGEDDITKENNVMDPES